MKKTILGATFIVAFGFVAGYGVYASQQKVEMSDLAMANVEALADYESEIEDLIKNCKWEESSYYNSNSRWKHSMVTLEYAQLLLT